MARPALNDDERAQRRSQLLAAAHQLYRSQHALPTVAEIAQAAGVAKGSVYLSFRTKEAIFIALLEDNFAQLLARMLPLLQQLPTAPDAAAHAFASAYAEQLGDLPDLLPLAAMTNAVLERNLPLQAMVDFKIRLTQGLTLAGTQLEQHLGGLLPAGGGADLLRRTWALTLGLWQSLDCPPAIKPQLVASLDARGMPHVLERDFTTELSTTVRQLWRGALLP
jgi:AcrR family transcriptional regulator